MAKVEEEVSTAAQNAGADDADVLARYTGPPVPDARPQGHFLVRFYRSAVGKKWVMAVTGVILLGFVLAHMIGNLKLLPGQGGDQPLRRGAARHARRTCCRAPSCCGRSGSC